VQELRLRGHAAVALPLIAIDPAPDEATVRRAWEALPSYSAVMFVSGNAVERFFLLKPAGIAFGGARPRAWAPGPGTSDALLRAGVPQSLIHTPASTAPQFDSQSLWQEVGEQVPAGGRVLVVRGGDTSGQGAGRDWLAGQLAQRGVAVDMVVAYCRRPPVWSPLQRSLALQAAHDGSLWLFSSSEAIAHLRTLAPDQSWQDAHALVTHPRIATAARDAGFGVVCLSRPILSDVMASIESIR
jgi:uroporphyrinogen-III synthase